MEEEAAAAATIDFGITDADPSGASTVSPFAILLGAGGIDDDGNATSPSTTASASGSAPYQNPAEGPIMLTIGIAGILSNVLCLAVLMKTQERKNAELKLSTDYLFLLRAQSIFDLLYLFTSTPITAFPYVFPDVSKRIEPFVLPWVFPFVQITMTASIYTTIAVAVERYLSIRDLTAPAKPFPVRLVVSGVAVFSLAINISRFFELRPVEKMETTLEKVNDTGDITVDLAFRHKKVYEVKPTYTVGYFLGYNMIGSFLITLLIPVVTLSVYNTLIWRRLQTIWKNRERLGVREKRNTTAAQVLILVVLLFFVCHSMKLVVSGYQLVDSLLSQVILLKWPRWVEICTFVSHFLLALGASVNILLYCSCDKRFFVVVQKTLKSWFVWPLTTKSSDVVEEEDDDDDAQTKETAEGQQQPPQQKARKSLHSAADESRRNQQQPDKLSRLDPEEAGDVAETEVERETRGGGGETQSLVKASAAETKSSPLNGTKSVTVATPEKKKGKEGPEDWV